MAACSTYDTGLLDESGSGSAYLPASGDQRADGGAGGDAGEPRDGEGAAPMCGDGKVAHSEKCDIAIATGSPGACPSSCPPLANCLARSLEGSHCQTECVVLAQSCAHADGCCPAGCNSASDDDCSQRCGDGIVQASEGETCESDSPSRSCATAADCDDRDPCTFDVLTGSATNCNALCSHSLITSFASGDRCCPSGADANSDSDCAGRCGNGVVEPGEECDGGIGCDGSCMRVLTSEQIACFERLGESGNACDGCSCMQCAPQRLACVDSGDATRDMHCATIIQCANDNDCNGDACYCADSYCRQAGPCRSVIDAAAAADPDAGSVYRQRDDLDTAIGRARAVGACKAASCSGSCP